MCIWIQIGAWLACELIGYIQTAPSCVHKSICWCRCGRRPQMLCRHSLIYPCCVCFQFFSPLQHWCPKVHSPPDMFCFICVTRFSRILSISAPINQSITWLMLTIYSLGIPCNRCTECKYRLSVYKSTIGYLYPTKSNCTLIFILSVFAGKRQTKGYLKCQQGAGAEVQ